MPAVLDARPVSGENLAISDIYASTLGRVDVFKETVRLVWLVPDQPEEGAAPIYRIAAKLILPRSAILPAIQRAAFELGYTELYGRVMDIMHASLGIH